MIPLMLMSPAHPTRETGPSLTMSQAPVWDVVELVERLRAQHVFPMSMLRLAEHECGELPTISHELPTTSRRPPDDLLMTSRRPPDDPLMTCMASPCAMTSPKPLANPTPRLPMTSP